MIKPEIKIGDNIKVHLKGESPWVKVLSMTENDFLGSIINKLFHEYSEHEQAQVMKRNWGEIGKLPKLHNYKQGDEVIFIWKSVNNEYGNWEPAIKKGNV